MKLVDTQTSSPLVRRTICQESRAKALRTNDKFTVSEEFLFLIVDRYTDSHFTMNRRYKQSKFVRSKKIRKNKKPKLLELRENN